MTNIQVLYQGPIVKRQDAISLGLDRYFTGRSCRNGHIDQLRIKGGCIECMKRRSAMRAIENKELKKHLDAEWQRNNKESVATRNRKWQVKNKHKFRAYRAEYRSLLNNAEGNHCGDDIIEHLIMQEYKCANCDCCLRENKYEVDHIIPLSKGGSNWPDNLQCLCMTCNRSKGNKLPEEWPTKTKGRIKRPNA